MQPCLENPKHTGKMHYDDCIDVSAYAANKAHRRKVCDIKMNL